MPTRTQKHLLHSTQHSKTVKTHDCLCALLLVQVSIQQPMSSTSGRRVSLGAKARVEAKHAKVELQLHPLSRKECCTLKRTEESTCCCWGRGTVDQNVLRIRIKCIRAHTRSRRTCAHAIAWHLLHSAQHSKTVKTQNL